MKGKRIILLGLCALAVVAVFADEPKKPAYQIADNTFFDPTAKTLDADEYHFGMEYRLEIGYVQHEQRTHELSYPDMYLHGARVGATFTFLLPKHFYSGGKHGPLIRALYMFTLKVLHACAQV